MAALPGAAVDDAAALVARVRALRTPAGTYTTSWFADAAEAARWVADGRLRLLDAPGCVLVLRRDRDFHHLYHAAESPDALSAALAATRGELAAHTLVADLVERPAAVEPIAARYAAAGFRPYSRLVRMSRPRGGAVPEPASPAEPAVRAGASDVPAVMAFFERLLDPYADQLPEAEEIAALAAQGHVLFVRHDGEVGGVLVYERRGQTAILRYWWVDVPARGAGVGARLLRTMLHDCRDAARIVLWVVEGNDNAIRRYEHYGFRREGLVDQLMLRARSTGA